MTNPRALATALAFTLSVTGCGHVRLQSPIAPAAGPPATFVELPALPGAAGRANASTGAAECTLEFEEPSGRKLRISLRGPATAQALELGRVLWRASP